MTSAGAYAPLAYELQLIDDATDAPAQSPEWISPAMAGTVTWNLSSPGVYSLIVSQYADVSAYDDLAETVAGNAEGTVRGLFDVSIGVDRQAAVPELTTCLMTIIGFVGLAWIATWRGPGAFRPGPAILSIRASRWNCRSRWLLAARRGVRRPAVARRRRRRPKYGPGAVLRKGPELCATAYARTPHVRILRRPALAVFACSARLLSP